MKSKQNLLLIFTRNPELGKCKTRLAATVGDQAALDIYIFLIKHTYDITKNVDSNKQVYYSTEIAENDLWDTNFEKKQQKGDNLGERMKMAFEQGFAHGYKNIIIIGSDMYDLNTQDLDIAFSKLENNDLVIGPAQDGGYYLLGMKKMHAAVFENKNWGTNTVLIDTLENLKNEKVQQLDIRNDVDYFEDIKDIAVFKPFLKHL